MKEFAWFEWFEWFGPSPIEPFNPGYDKDFLKKMGRLQELHEELTMGISKLKMQHLLDKARS